MKKIITSVVLVIAGSSAHALDAGDMLIRLGSSTDIPHEGTKASTGGVPIAADVALERSGGAVGSLSYMFTQNIALGFMITSPINHPVDGHGGLSLNIAEYDVMYPTLTAEYHQEFGNFKPYIGAGATYAVFMDTGMRYSPSAENFSVDNKLAPAFELGIDYKLNETTYVNLSAVYINLNTDAQIRGGINVDLKMDVNPVLWNFSFVHKM